MFKKKLGSVGVRPVRGPPRANEELCGRQPGQQQRQRQRQQQRQRQAAQDAPAAPRAPQAHAAAQGERTCILNIHIYRTYI